MFFLGEKGLEDLDSRLEPIWNTKGKDLGRYRTLKAQTRRFIDRCIEERLQKKEIKT